MREEKRRVGRIGSAWWAIAVCVLVGGIAIGVHVSRGMRPSIKSVATSGDEVAQVTGAVPATDAVASPATLERGSVIELAAEDAADPWSCADGTGFANDVVTEAYAAVDIEAKLTVLPYARAKYMTLEGEIAGCFSMSPELGLEGVVTLADEPLFEVRFDLFRKVDGGLRASDATAIPSGTVIGKVIGYEYPPSVAEMLNQGVIFDESADEVAILKKLAAGRIDAGIINHNEVKTAEGTMARAGALGRVELAFPGEVMGSYIGFSTRHPMGDLARRKFNEGYGIIRENGVLDRITSEWSARAEEEAQPGE